MSDALAKRLNEYNNKRWKRSEALKIINEFVMSPLLVNMIENMNKVHKIAVCTDDSGVAILKFQCERSKKGGLWNKIKNFFSPYETCLSVYKENHLFICEYYKHGFFEVSEKIKIEYDEKLKDTFNAGLVVICRA